MEAGIESALTRAAEADEVALSALADLMEEQGRQEEADILRDLSGESGFSEAYKDGHNDGDGYGDGCSHGDGLGNGWGNGDGRGRGDGDIDGGYGDNRGDGDGYGYGYDDGDGRGRGDGNTGV